MNMALGLILKFIKTCLVSFCKVMHTHSIPKAIKLTSGRFFNTCVFVIANLTVHTISIFLYKIVYSESFLYAGRSRRHIQPSVFVLFLSAASHFPIQGYVRVLQGYLMDHQTQGFILEVHLGGLTQRVTLRGHPGGLFWVKERRFFCLLLPISPSEGLLAYFRGNLGTTQPKGSPWVTKLGIHVKGSVGSSQGATLGFYFWVKEQNLLYARHCRRHSQPSIIVAVFSHLAYLSIQWAFNQLWFLLGLLLYSFVLSLNFELSKVSQDS